MMPRCSLSEIEREAALRALIDDLALVGAVGIDAAQHLHQGRFAGAVFAADRVDLACSHDEIDVAQRLHAGKALGDPPHFQDSVHRLTRLQPNPRQAPGMPPSRRKGPAPDGAGPCSSESYLNCSAL